MPTKIKKTVKAVKAKIPKIKTPKPIGKITHYYDKIGVGIIKLKAGIKIGEVLRFKHKEDEFIQAVTSLQYSHKPVRSATKGKSVGVEVKQKVREGDLVYKA